jgi:hypothetical protein
MTRRLALTGLFAVGLTACWHASPLGSDAGVDADADTDSDSDADSDDDEDFCLPGEVQQPETDLCWWRCPLGQTWDGDTCEGSAPWMNWCQASGITLNNHCEAIDEGTSQCEALLGAGYRLPTNLELANLLGNCESDVLNGGNGYCDTCETSATCSGMFGDDSDWYWSSKHYGSFAHHARFSQGLLFQYGLIYGSAVRCVRSGP